MSVLEWTTQSNQPPTSGTCQLLGPVSLLIQFLMGTLVVSVLLIKRQYEHPRRKMVVWGYDTAKQVGGALGIHFINLGFSILKESRKKRRERDNLVLNFLVYLISLSQGPRSGPRSEPEPEPEDDQCDWFFLNLLMDTTVGIPVLWLNLRISETVLRYFGVRNIESGNYFGYKELQEEEEETEVAENGGRLPLVHNRYRRPLFSAFVKQFSIFMFGLLVTKSVVFLVLTEFDDIAVWFANLILGWADPWPDFQVFLVMFVSPILLNCFQYCCIDSIIKVHGTNFHIDSFEPETLLPPLDAANDSSGSPNGIYRSVGDFRANNDEYDKILETSIGKKDGAVNYGSTN